MRDFLYVSGRKVDRMVATLPDRAVRRWNALQLTAGPLGAGVTLDHRRAPSSITWIAEVEKNIRREHAIRSIDDLNLTPGEWISCSSIDMAYGVQMLAGKGVAAAAVFVSQCQAGIVLLSGSAEYLLDRSNPSANGGSSMSDPQAIDQLLKAVSAGSPYDEQSTADYKQTRNSFHAAATLYSDLSRFGLHRLGFLARAMEVARQPDRTGSDLVVASPVFVEFAR
jgi:hypothetical protein